MLPEIDVHDVGDEEVLKGLRAGRGFVDLSKVSPQGFLSAFKVAFTASCAELASAMQDDPSLGAAWRGPEVEPRRLCWSGHAVALSIISRIALSQTTNLPASLTARNRPLSISVCNERFVMLPPGKNRAAASSSE
jgi:hypothetical protein